MQLTAVVGVDALPPSFMSGDALVSLFTLGLALLFSWDVLLAAGLEEVQPIARRTPRDADQESSAEQSAIHSGGLGVMVDGSRISRRLDYLHSLLASIRATT